MRRCAALLRRSWSLSGGTAIEGFRRRPQFRLPLLSYADDAQRAVPSVVAPTFTAISLPRTFSSTSSPSGSSNMHLIKSEEQFNSMFAKIQDESSPAFVYFTVARCGPAYMSAFVKALTEEYPHVTAYKIDIDPEGIRDKLMELGIDCVGRLHFLSKGHKEDEIVRAAVKNLNYIMSIL